MYMRQSTIWFAYEYTIRSFIERPSVKRLNIKLNNTGRRVSADYLNVTSLQLSLFDGVNKNELELVLYGNSWIEINQLQYENCADASLFENRQLSMQWNENKVLSFVAKNDLKETSVELGRKYVVL